MIWNNEFLITSPSVFDGILTSEDTDLSDILFQEDLLQELKTLNANLIHYLIKPEVMTQLIDNITQLTEKDCFDKLLYSRVHAAYISCEILTAGSSEIFDALLASPNSLDKIFSCLIREQKPEKLSKESEKKGQESSTLQDGEKVEPVGQLKTDAIQEELSTKSDEGQETSTEKPMQNGCVKTTKEENTSDTTPIQETTHSPIDSSQSLEKEDADENSPNQSVPVDKVKVVPQKATLISKLISNIHSQAPADLSCFITKNIGTFSDLIQILVNNIDVSGSFEILSTFINRTNPPELRYVFCEILSKLNFVFSLMNVMTLSNVEDKQRNACQLLCDIIVIGRQEATEQTGNGPSAQDMLAELIVSKKAAHVMLKQMFSHKAIGDVTQFKKKPKDTSSTDSDDDRKDGADIVETEESARAPPALASQEEAEPNKTAIICGMKVLQILVEQKVNNSLANSNHVQNNISLVTKTIEQIQDEIAENLINFHELLLNPPKQEPIKTTFGVIQKPLGFIRLEVVNLIRALLGTFSPVIIKKLVELKTMKIIIDLFVDYSWNNLLHTQVEQAVTYIIKNCRRDEDLKYQIDMQKHTTNHITDESTNQLTLQQNQERGEQVQQQEQEQKASDNESQQQQHVHLKQNGTSNGIETNTDDLEVAPPSDDKLDGEVATQAAEPTTTDISFAASSDNKVVEASSDQSPHSPTATLNGPTTTTSYEKPVASNDEELPSLALLSQLLNECDLIGRLLMPRDGGKQANFGHIIQMINSIAISCDLDTIQEHLNAMKEERPISYNRWTQFVNVDVASFKEISLYYDVQSVNNHTDNSYEYLQKRNQSLSSDQHGYYSNSSQNHHQTRPHLNQLSNSSENEVKSINGNGDAHSTPYFAYYSFTKEAVIPSINVDVLPKSRGSTTNKNSSNY